MYILWDKQRVSWLCEFSSEAMEDAGKPHKSGNPSRKVVDLAAGEAHNLILTGE